MGEYRNDQPLDVIGNYEVAPLDKCQRLGRVVQRKAAARAHAKVQYVGVARCPNYSDEVVNKRFVDRDLSHLVLKRQHAVAVHHWNYVINRRVQSLLPKYGLFILSVWIAHSQSHHKAVELRFRKRISSVMLDWILRRKHYEWTRQLIRLLLNGDVTLGHCFEERRLRFGSRAIDLVGKYHVGEDRSRLEFERARALVEDLQSEDVGRQHIGSELYALKGAIEASRKSVREGGLSDAGNVLDKKV